MLGAYLFYVFRNLCGLGFPACIVAALGGTAAFMVGIDRVAYFQLRRRRVPSWAIIITSIAVSVTVEAGITMIFGNTIRIVVPEIPRSVTVLGASITVVQIAILGVAVAAMVLMSVFLRRTRIGKVIRAIANDKTMATVIGIDVERVYILVTVLGSLLASIAGILISFETNLYPYMSHPAGLKAITASIVGGVGNIPGAMIAGYLLGLAENFGVWIIGSGWRDAISLVIIVAMLLIRPSFFGMEEHR
jgi:branched-chain amino acid transport system permease protein